MIRKLINAIKEFEEEIRANEKYLSMRLQIFEEQNSRITALLNRTDITDSEKIQTLKNYFQ